MRDTQALPIALLSRIKGIMVMNIRVIGFAATLCLLPTSVRAADSAADDAARKADKAAEKADKAADDAANKAADKADRAADKTTAGRAGNGAVVNGESLTSETRRDAPAERFGRRGRLAISSDAALTISNTTLSGVSGSTTNIQLEPAVDYFVINNLSIGGFVEFMYTSASSGHASTFGIGPRVGYNFSLSDLVSIWPKAGLSIDYTSSTGTVVATGLPAGTTVSRNVSATNVALNLYVPLMFHPATHFFAGLGPFLDTDLSGDPRATTWGAKLTLGGWL